MQEIIFIVLIILYASIVQTITGFGMSLLAIPFLSFILPFEVIVPVMAITNFGLNTMNFIVLRKYVKYKTIIVLFIFATIGTFFGMQFLSLSNNYVLKILAGFIVITTSIVMFLGYTKKIEKGNLVYPIAGLGSGFLNGSLNMGGPPIAIFCCNLDLDKNQYRASITTYFLFLNVVTILMYTLTDKLVPDTISLLIYIIPAIAAGSFTGNKLIKKVNEVLFKRIIFILLSLSGISILINGILEAIK